MADHKHKVITSDAKIDAALHKARARKGEAVAQKVEHIARWNLLIVVLSNGRRLVVPVEDLQGLHNATHKELQQYELMGGGTGISFPKLDADFYVPALIAGIYGTRSWMTALGRRNQGTASEVKHVAAEVRSAATKTHTGTGKPRKASVAV